MNKDLCREAHEYRIPRNFDGPLAEGLKKSKNEDMLMAIME
jgi:hypothetical protein